MKHSSEYNIRKTRPSDIPQIMEVVYRARRYMRECGNLTQWVNGYPSESVIINDIEKGVSYVMIDNEGRVRATFAFIVGEDPTYNVIENGSWLNDRPYGTIHRIASDGTIKGVLSKCLDYCFGIIDTIRIDTHKDNAKMLELLDEEAFSHCGMIYCQDGTPREAFMKTLPVDY